MNLEQTKKLAQHIFRLLKVNEMVFPIGRTNKGNLGLKFSNNTEDFDIMLDAVPLSTKDMLNDDNNIELKRMIEKYWLGEVRQTFYPTELHLHPNNIEEFEKIVDNGTEYRTASKVVDRAGNDVTDKVLGKKRGRPVGSKNKK